MADIFISYSKESHAQTEQLANELQAKGFSVWYDTSLVPGDSFRNVIVSELTQARAAIVIWTADSVQSEWVCSEASRARARRILIPVRADDIRSHDIPPPFDSLHAELLSNRAAIDAALAKLGVVPPGSSASRPALAPSNKPSIAVLPFNNMSGDPEQEFFADGLTEDIITELSRFRDLLVISRNSAFVHKGKAVKVQEVAREFGVHYVVEGSVRKASDRVRVTVQLIDAETDTHIWAERFDRQLRDIFAIQDEVTSAIVATLSGRVEAATHERVKRKPTENMAAYEYLLTGKVLHHRSAREANAEALRMLNHAIELDPKYAHAHAWKACVIGQSWVYGWCPDKASAVKQVAEEVEIALSLDDNDADVHRILAALNLNIDNHDKAAYHQERALSLNPNNDLIVVQQGELLTWLGRAEEGIEWIRRAMRLNPYHPERYWNHLGRAHYTARSYAETIESFSRITRPDYTHHAFLAAASAQLGNDTAAGTHAQQVLGLQPTFAARLYLTTLHYRREEDREHYRDGLIKAGLPE